MKEKETKSIQNITMDGKVSARRSEVGVGVKTCVSNEGWNSNAMPM